MDLSAVCLCMIFWDHDEIAVCHVHLLQFCRWSRQTIRLGVISWAVRSGQCCVSHLNGLRLIARLLMLGWWGVRVMGAGYQGLSVPLPFPQEPAQLPNQADSCFIPGACKLFHCAITYNVMYTYLVCPIIPL